MTYYFLVSRFDLPGRATLRIRGTLLMRWIATSHRSQSNLRLLRHISEADTA
jgi:hypothetical protein